jgi:hypothetical protein
MSPPADVAGTSGRPCSPRAVRRSAWASRGIGLPLTGVPAYYDVAAGSARASARGRHDPQGPA